MSMYWLLFLLPTLAVISPWRLSVVGQRLMWLAMGGLFALLAGFRHEVGGDWFTYLEHFQSVRRMTLSEAMEFGDPGYYAVMWAVAKQGLSVHWSNLISASIVMVGVSVFARRQPMPWLALLVAVPYLIIVVAMGYTRQSAALGFALLGLTALGQQQIRWFVVWILVGAAFHKSAVLLLPIAALSASKNRTWTFFWVGMTSIAGAYFFVADDSEALVRNYIESEYQSQGGMIRVTMNAVPAMLFLWWQRRLDIDERERKLWFWLSLFALACVPLIMVLPSTAVDRVALYFIPIQMYVFSRLHRIAKTTIGRTRVVVAVVAYYALVQFVWLNYAGHSRLWVPYQFMPW